MTAGAVDRLSSAAPAGPCADLAEDPEGKPEEQTDYCLIHGLTARRGTEITRRSRSIAFHVGSAERNEKGRCQPERTSPENQVRDHFADASEEHEADFLQVVSAKAVSGTAY